MAFPWLDAARYADSNGYQTDGERFMWRWRDWVIDAFNRNMPYDQFTIEQLAGDLLPNATLDQKIATGFNRNHRGNSEGGIIPEEYAVEYVVDRVDTTSTVFLGLTVGCARCHNHKFDPVTQKEFYQLFAYFNNVPEHGKFRRVGNSPPYHHGAAARAAGAVEAARRSSWRPPNAAYAKLQPDLARAQQDWERSLDTSSRWYGRRPADWLPTIRSTATRTQVAVLQEPRVRVSASAPRGGAVTRRLPRVRTTTGAPAPALRPAGSARRRASTARASFNSAAISPGSTATARKRRARWSDPTVTYDDAYTIAAWIYPTAATGAIVTRDEDVVRAQRTRAEPERRKDRVQLRDQVGRRRHPGPDGEAVSLNQWHHVALTYDGSRWASGVKIYVDGERSEVGDPRSTTSTARAP